MKLNRAFLQKNKTHLLIILGLILLFFITRLSNLLLVPMFTDEAIYLRWSQVGERDAAWRFIPLTDGKPPLYHWIIMGVMATNVIENPLIEGRVVSIAAGAMSLIFIWMLAYALFKKVHVAHIAALFYVVSPMMVVYDRLAVVDSLLTTFAIVTLLLAVLLVRYKRLDLALLMGASVGAAMLTKASGLIFLALSPATFLIGEWKLKNKAWIKQGLKWIGMLVIVAVVSQVIYSILRLSQFFYRIEQKNYEFIIPLSAFFADPFAWTWGNLKTLIRWQVGYLTLPWLMLVFVAFSYLKRWRAHLVLLAQVIPVVIFLSTFNKIIFPRFLLFSMPFLLILAASGMEYLLTRIKTKPAQFMALVLFIAWPLYTSVMWITNPVKAAIPQADKDQYYQGQPSGHGVNEINEFISQQATNQKVFLGTDGTFGLTPDAFLVNFIDNPQVHVEGYFPVDKVPEEVVAQASQSATYFVYFNVQDIPVQPNLELIQEHPKVSPNGTTYLRLYQVNPYQ